MTRRATTRTSARRAHVELEVVMPRLGAASCRYRTASVRRRGLYLFYLHRCATSGSHHASLLFGNFEHRRLDRIDRCGDEEIATGGQPGLAAPFQARPCTASRGPRRMTNLRPAWSWWQLEIAAKKIARKPVLSAVASVNAALWAPRRCRRKVVAEARRRAAQRAADDACVPKPQFCRRGRPRQ